MDRSKPVPIPMSQRLRDMRTRVVPALVFGAAVLVTVMLWRDAITPAMLVGEVKTVRSTVNSPVPALLHRLTAQRLQPVKAGDVLAELVPSDPRQALDLLQNELSLLRAEASATESAQDIAASRRREALDYERLKLDWMAEKVALVVAQSEAKRAAMDLELAQGLVNAPAGSQRYTQEAQLAREKADAEVAARQALVDSLGQRMEELSVSPADKSKPADDRWQKAVQSLEQRLASVEKNHGVIVLRAPIDGMVTEVLRRTGENVTQGEPLVVVTATQPESIVGYLRQPLPVEPVVGQQVEVRTQGRERLKGMALVTRVGAHFEPIINPALHPATTPEVGLPVEISLPPNLRLRPGELVGLLIKSDDTVTPAF